MSTVAAPRAAVLGPLRDWLRDVTAVASLCGTDTNLAEPSIYAGGLASGATFPAVVVTKVGLSPDGTSSERHLIQLDCWADAARDAEELAAEVKTALEQVVPGTQLGSSDVRLWGATIEAEVALPDPDDGTARFVITANATTTVVD
jgi:hypothetical protein